LHVACDYVALKARYKTGEWLKLLGYKVNTDIEIVKVSCR